MISETLKQNIITFTRLKYKETEMFCTTEDNKNGVYSITFFREPHRYNGELYKNRQLYFVEKTELNDWLRTKKLQKIIGQL